MVDIDDIDTEHIDEEGIERIERMEPPSEDNDHCGNCWLPRGECADWCPHCQIHNEYVDSDE